MAKILDLVVDFIFNITRKMDQIYSENMTRMHGLIKAFQESQRIGALEVIVNSVGRGGEESSDCTRRYSLRFDHQYTL